MGGIVKWILRNLFFRSEDTLDAIKLDLKEELFDPIIQSAGHLSSSSRKVSILRSSFSGIASITNHALLTAGPISVKVLQLPKGAWVYDSKSTVETPVSHSPASTIWLSLCVSSASRDDPLSLLMRGINEYSCLWASM
jgi:hypothetical protein